MQFKNHEEQTAFELWAFGGTGVRYGEHLMHTFNSRHGKQLWITTDEVIKDSLEKMYELYVKELKI